MFLPSIFVRICFMYMSLAVGFGAVIDDWWFDLWWCVVGLFLA